MNVITLITLNSTEVKSVWGGFAVICKGTATIQHTKNHSEYYPIEFKRDQLTGRTTHIEALPRFEDTTEYTLMPEVVQELCYEYLNDN